jgi:hypothetical protein
MASRATTRFDEVLSDLFRARTHNLRSFVVTKRGRSPKVTKKRVFRAIAKLQDIAEQIYFRSRDCKQILKGYDYKRRWHSKNKGHGRTAKKRNFKGWYDKHISTKNCVYVFWNKKGCLYIGRTLNGKGRPTGHFEKHWFGKASRVDVYGFDRKRDVSRFECVTTHKWAPSYSRITPASKRYYSRCPICDGRREVRDEIKSLFRLR